MLNTQYLSFSFYTKQNTDENIVTNEPIDVHAKRVMMEKEKAEIKSL